MLAMGRADMLAQRPLVMGGLLQASPWLGITWILICIELQAHQKASGPTLTKSSSIWLKPPLGYYQRRGKPRGTLQNVFLI